MYKKYVGKTCPYCKTPLVDGDTVVLCSVCDMPHHLSCWQDNQGCTTFGCTGSVKKIIENTSGGVAVPTSYRSVPVSVQAEKRKPIETLYESKEMVFMSNVPVVLENSAVIIDRTKDTIFARCIFRSIAEKAIKAVLIEIVCQDIWGSTLGEPIVFQYLDLKTKRDTKFGQTIPIELSDKTTRKIRVSVKKVLFGDDTIIDSGNIVFAMPAPTLLREYLESEELATEYARETTATAQYVLEEGSCYWFCTCGALNEISEECCHICGCTKAQLITALNPDTLQTNMILFAKEKKAAAEKAKAEQLERIRQAEERMRLEQERKKQELEKEQKLKKKKKRRRKIVMAIILSLVIIALLSCGMVFFGIPYLDYCTACDAMANGEYETAYQMFEELGDFMDSKDLALESQYKEARSLLATQKYDSAYKLFLRLGSYDDAYKNMTYCIYSWADYVLSVGDKEEAYNFKVTVSLEPEHYSTIYSNIQERINRDAEFDYLDDSWNGTEQATVVYTMLQTLPSSYKDTASLQRLFRLLANGDIHAIVE